MEAQQQQQIQKSPRTTLREKIQSQFDFLSDLEISTFVDMHRWLTDNQEKVEEAIILDFLCTYFKNLAERHNEIYIKIKEFQEQQKQFSIVQEQQTKQQQINPDLISQLNQNNTNNQNQNQQQQQLYPQFEDEKDEKIILDDDVVDSFVKLVIQKLEFMKLFFENIKFPNEFTQHCEFLYFTLNNLSSFPENEDYRQPIMYKKQFRDYKTILDILQLLGFFNFDLGDDNSIQLGFSEKNTELLGKIAAVIDQQYLQNYQSSNNQNNQQQQQQQQQQPQFQDRSEMLAYKHEQRLKNKNSNNTYQQKNNSVIQPQKQNFSNGSQSQQFQQFRVNDTAKKQNLQISNYNKQINDYREKMRTRIINKNYSQQQPAPQYYNYQQQPNQDQPQNFFQRITSSFKNKFVTMSEIEKKRVEEDKVNFGYKALELTNEFRQKFGYMQLNWNQSLCDIAMIHSKAMAERKFPLGHDGFQKRVDSIPFMHGLVAENVAYCQGQSDIPKTIVDGWINSPGHCKNLLSRTNACGIAVYKSDDGRWYFTQLFAHKY